MNIVLARLWPWKVDVPPRLGGDKNEKAPVTMMRRRPGAFVCEGHREAIPTHNPFRLNVCRGIQTQQKEP